MDRGGKEREREREREIARLVFTAWNERSRFSLYYCFHDDRAWRTFCRLERRSLGPISSDEKCFLLIYKILTPAFYPITLSSTPFISIIFTDFRLPGDFSEIVYYFTPLLSKRLFFFLRKNVSWKRGRKFDMERVNLWIFYQSFFYTLAPLFFFSLLKHDYQN